MSEIDKEKALEDVLDLLQKREFKIPLSKGREAYIGIPVPIYEMELDIIIMTLTAWKPLLCFEPAGDNAPRTAGKEQE